LALAGALSVLLAAIALDYIRAQRRSATRLARFGLLGGSGETRAPVRANTPAELLRHIGAGLAKRTENAQLQRLRATLVRAGLVDRMGVEEFLGLRLLMLVLG